MTPAMLAAFSTPETLVIAARGAANRNWRALDAFTPFPIEALNEALRIPRPKLPWLMLCAGLAAASVIYGLQWWSATRGYPFAVGGRALNAWPTFLIASVELGILAAGAAGFVGLLFGCGLPRLNHPLFDSIAFERASQDQFLILLPADLQTRSEVRAFLFDSGAIWVEAVEL